MKRLLTCTFIVLYLQSSAQPGSWNIANIKANFSEKWNVFIEAQLRSLSFYNQYHYYEIKGGVSYSISKNFTFSGGLGNYNTYQPGGNFKTPILNDEFRSWLQVALKQNIGVVKLEHRYRAEQRWTSIGYRNRFRYRLQSIVPINKKQLQPGVLYAIGWNELFFTNKPPYFERNRLLVGCGYEINNNISVQIGFLHQFDYKLNDETGRDFLQLSFFYEIDIMKKKLVHVPGSID